MINRTEPSFDLPSQFQRLKPALRDLCRKYHIRRLLLFGSTLDRTRGAGSDIDLIAEFDPGFTPGFSFARIRDELTALLAAPVDLHTPASLSRYFRDEVLQEARVVYAEKE